MQIGVEDPGPGALASNVLRKKMKYEKNQALAVVLASGGMDSCVTSAYADQNYKLAMLHVNYGQQTSERELAAFNDIADFYKVKNSHRLTVDISHLLQIGGSSLTDPKEKIEDGDLLQSTVPRTYVPYRNGNLISIAASWAEVIGARSIWLGVVEEDGSGYPDCRADFINAQQKAINLGTACERELEICTPLIKKDKTKIVQLGKDLGAPLHLSWSCYRENEHACGKCDSCLLRLRGFAGAGFTDPIPYR
jgi:7-cyano-7-deazaguanine synthase